MTRFLALCSAILFSILSVALFGVSSASAQTADQFPFYTSQGVYHQVPGGQVKDHTTDWQAFFWDNFKKRNTSDYTTLKASFDHALQNGGAWGVTQHEGISDSKEPYKIYYIFWTEKADCDFHITLNRGDVSIYYLNSRKTSDPGCKIRQVAMDLFPYSMTPSYYIQISFGNPSNNTYRRLFLFTGDYTVQEGIDKERLGISSGPASDPEDVRPNFKLSVADKDIQVEHIKEYDRLPGYPDDEPRLMFYVWSCSKRITNREFNPGSPGVEKVFGFIKAAIDPLIDVGNLTSEAFLSNSPKLSKIPDIERDRILWCEGSKVLKSELGSQGQNFKFTAEKHDYYIVSLEYVFERVHKYDSAITPDYRYIVTPDNTKEYRYFDTSYVFEADGRTFSTDTFSGDCRRGFCDLPPAEKDCSYEQQGAWSGVIKCNIDNFFKRFTNFFKWLFVPDGLTIKNHFDETMSRMNSSFGFLALPFTFVGNVFNSVNQVAAAGSTCALPPLSIFGAQAQLHLCAWRHQLPVVWSFMQKIIQIGISIGFLWVSYRLLMRVFGVSVDDHDDEDDIEYEEVRWRDDRTGESGDWMRRRK